MTPDELKEILRQLGLSQVEASKMLEVEDRTMRRYIKGDRPVPGATKKLLRLLAARPELLPVVKEMAA